MNENRVLVRIAKIDSIEPVFVKSGEPARSELAHIGGWRATVGKGEFQAGDLVVFAEPDSIFPEDDRWRFLERYHWKIKTQKYNNILTANGEKLISQGLILPLSVLPEGAPTELGADVTNVLGVTHAPEVDEDPYEANAEFDTKGTKQVHLNWLPKGLNKKMMRYGWYRKMVLPKPVDKGFPKEVSKTDEERIQNCGQMLKVPTRWTATEKVDGMSSTYLLRRKKASLWKRILGKREYEFVICSRNNKLGPNSTFPQVVMAKKYNVEKALEKLIGDNAWVCGQGEVAGPKIQQNRQGLTENRLFIFNLIYPTGRVKSLKAKEMVEEVGLEFVPIVADGVIFGEDATEEMVLKYADGYSLLNKNKRREGIVFRSEREGVDLSFKAVSPEYLLKIGE